MAKEFHPINFGPLATNILDYVGKKGLSTRDGRVVEINYSYFPTTFRVYFEGKEVYSYPENISVSHFLNENEVGVFA
jgi:hypothetical protein